MKILKLLFFLIILVLGAAFAVLNAETVSLDYYFGMMDLPLSFIIVASLSFGAVLGILASSSIVFRLKHEISGLRRQARLSREEVNNLRTIPLRDQ